MPIVGWFGNTYTWDPISLSRRQWIGAGTRGIFLSSLAPGGVTKSPSHRQLPGAGIRVTHNTFCPSRRHRYGAGFTGYIPLVTDFVAVRSPAMGPIPVPPFLPVVVTPGGRGISPGVILGYSGSGAATVSGLGPRPSIHCRPIPGGACGLAEV